MKDGLDVTLLEHIGDVESTKMSRRHAHDQPKTTREFWIMSTNYHPKEVFGEEKWETMLKRRVYAVQVSRRHNLFRVANLIRRANGFSPLPPPPPPRNLDLRLPSGDDDSQDDMDDLDDLNDLLEGDADDEEAVDHESHEVEKVEEGAGEPQE